jgi:hypothetical protein
MTRTQRTIGIGAFVMLGVLGTGWALEKASSTCRAQRGAAVSEPAKASDTAPAPVPRERREPQPSATGSSQESDRSDLLLSQG